ncbi:MAG: hypothetical protein GY822_27095 [Deltaproteobacteria bacterium]|nr:hypothetical protein [Deltaproteobacteria bacterium]
MYRLYRIVLDGVPYGATGTETFSRYDAALTGFPDFRAGRVFEVVAVDIAGNESEPAYFTIPPWSVETNPAVEAYCDEMNNPTPEPDAGVEVDLLDAGTPTQADAGVVVNDANVDGGTSETNEETAPICSCPLSRTASASSFAFLLPLFGWLFRKPSKRRRSSEHRGPK